MTRLQERITTAGDFNRGDRVLVRSITAITGELEREGFRVSVSPCWGKTPFSNVLVVGERASKPL